MSQTYEYENCKCTVQDEWYSVEMCRANPEKIYVFGDNSIRIGKGGQAIIRDEPNVFGVMTKLLPSQRPNSFLTDSNDHRTMVFDDLYKLQLLYNAGVHIILPAAGLGTGLAEMHKYAPMAYKKMNQFIKANLLISN